MQLQDGLNIDFNGISAIYATGGSGARTASIVAGSGAPGTSGSPAISLAPSSSVSVDSNVTLTIGLTIADPQTGATALDKIGGGTLVLSGSNTFTGGIDVQSGSLILTNAYGLEDGSSLTVGAGGTFIFDPSASASSLTAAPQVHPVAVEAVPEPSSLVLLVAAAIAGAICRRRRS